MNLYRLQDGSKFEVSKIEFEITLDHDLRCLVREAAYHLMMVEAESSEKGHAYSRSVALYERAADLLSKYYGKDEARNFLNSTYQPITSLVEIVEYSGVQIGMFYLILTVSSEHGAKRHPPLRVKR
jgi:hypothetical protein